MGWSELLWKKEQKKGTLMKIIGHVYTDFPSKFGIPRQSGLVEALKGKIVFEPEFHNPQAFRGLETFTHIWILWKFSESHRERWAATVKPPRLGGKKRMGEKSQNWAESGGEWKKRSGGFWHGNSAGCYKSAGSAFCVGQGVESDISRVRTPAKPPPRVYLRFAGENTFGPHRGPIQDRVLR